jgi:uncharacterized membrane protein YfcA
VASENASGQVPRFVFSAPFTYPRIGGVGAGQGPHKWRPSQALRYQRGVHLSLFDLAAITLLGVLSGSLGAITGIGGGVIIVPMLVLVFGFDFPTAVTASLAAVIATSTTTGSAYVGEGLTNMRLAMTLEVATTAGGISGGFLGLLLPQRALSAIFAVAMTMTAVLVARGRAEQSPETTGGLAADPTSIPTNTGPLDARYYDPELNAKVVYRVQRVPLGMGVSYGAGIMSGLLGVGGGFIKVPGDEPRNGSANQGRGGDIELHDRRYRGVEPPCVPRQGRDAPGRDDTPDPRHGGRRDLGEPTSGSHRIPPGSVDAGGGGRRWLIGCVESADASFRHCCASRLRYRLRSCQPAP